MASLWDEEILRKFIWNILKRKIIKKNDQSKIKTKVFKKDSLQMIHKNRFDFIMSYFQGSKSLVQIG